MTEIFMKRIFVSTNLHFLIVLLIIFISIPTFLITGIFFFSENRDSLGWTVLATAISFLVFLFILFQLKTSIAEQVQYQRSNLHQVEKELANERKEHHEAAEALSKSELLFGQIWEISVDGMRLTDEQGKIIAVNDAFCHLVEMKKEELEGKLFPVIYSEKERPDALEMYEMDLQNNALKTHFEHARTLWNKKEVWFEFSNSFVEIDGSGRIVLSVINDITERKMSEIEIFKSEKRYRMLFNNGNDAVFVNHLTPDKKFGPFIEVNDIACYRLGYAREELQHMDLPSTIPDRYKSELETTLEKLLTDNHAIFEVMQMRKDKRQMPVEISAHLFEFDGKPTVLSIARDITQRKRVEARLKHSGNQLRKLSSRLQEIREEERTMIARELHDELGQVLTVLKIQVALCSNKLHTDQQDLREKIEYVSTMLDQMVETVQKISSKLRPGMLDELGLLSAIEWQSQEFQQRTGIICDISLPKVDIELEKEKSTAIFRIFQEALTNIARHANANKFSVILKQNANFITLEVTDNGNGIRKIQMEDPSSLGILGMKERALVVGGIVKIFGAAGEGTHVKVEIPV
jgi:two-component system sensor histidine kinase UhpB